MTSPTILTEGRNYWRRCTAERVAFLIDGAAYFAAFAAAVERARESIVIVGWDVDSRVCLTPAAEGRHLPAELGALLKTLVSRRRRLHVYVLEWDFAWIFALERESAAIHQQRWQTHRRIHFRLDGAHPAGASHHQKIVVIDDALAFVGGIDISNRRWDTPEHAACDPRRTDVDGILYPPVHDVQVAVDGEAAAALGQLVRERWRRATGRRLRPPRRADRELWPSDVEPDLEHVSVAIARTAPAYNNHPQVREVEALYLDAIAAARRFIYLESQYLTSAVIGEALAHRLSQPDGPEVVLVLPRKASGWLEQQTMDVLRARLLQRLREADRFRRLRIYCPVVPGLANACINIHSKILVIDDRLVRVGSSNMSNRSMGLDTECDLALEAGDDTQVRRAVAGFRDRLLGEHLGRTAPEVAMRLAATRSLIATINSLRHGERWLEPLEAEVPSWRDRLIPDSHFVDPESPLVPEQLLELCAAPETRRSSQSRLLYGAAALLVLIGLAAAWRWTPLAMWLEIETLVAWVTALREHPLAPLVVISGYVVGGLVLIPVTLLITATALACGPLLGFIYSLIGCLLSATLTYGLGYLLGHDIIHKFPGAHLSRLSRRLGEHGFMAVLVVRIVPVAPFTVINMIAGASHIRLRDFVLGTSLGMLPGLLLMTVFGDQLEDVIRDPRGEGVLILIGVVALLGLFAFWARRRFGQTTPLAAPEACTDE
jgi:phospholipase D1/2